MGLLVEPRIFLQFLIQGRKLSADAGTEIGERTARVNEGHEQSLAAILIERDVAAILIHQLEIRDRLAGFGDVKIGRWLRRRNSRVRNNGDVTDGVLTFSWTSVAVMESPTANGSSSLARFTLYGIAIASMNPGMASPFTTIMRSAYRSKR